MTFIDYLDYAGVFVFAATGALAASRRRLDIIGFIFLANMTGVGGGTVRDLVLGNTPVNWVREPIYLLIGTSAAILVYFTAYRVESRYRILLWLDAVGMAMFCVMGAEKALQLGFNAWVAIVSGVFTATLGGVMRDMMAEVKSLYQTSSFESALEAIRADCKLAAVTRSEHGSIIVRGDETVQVDAIEIDMLVDTTGAGDLYAAGFLYGYTNGYDLVECGKFGSLAAGIVIQQIGPRPLNNLKDIAAQAGLLKQA